MNGSTVTSKFFDSYAHDFNAIYGNSNALSSRLINRFFRKSMRLRYEMCLAGCEPIAGKTVLDIGCGPGHYSVALAKAGAAEVEGVDFAPNMIGISQHEAEKAGVADRCHFRVCDFLAEPMPKKYDYTIVMGFMDYVQDPRPLIEKVLSATRCRAFFSFPRSGGLLAWQRKRRYQSRCPLYLYSMSELQELFAGLPVKNVEIEPISRDCFVTAEVS